MNSCGGSIWQTNTYFLGSGKGFNCGHLLYKAWSASPVWQEMRWNDPGVSSDQKELIYFSLVFNPFRIFSGKKSSDRETQLDKLHLQAADHPGWQAKNPLISHGTKLPWEVCTQPLMEDFGSHVLLVFSVTCSSHNKQCCGLCHVTGVAAKCSATRCAVEHITDLSLAHQHILEARSTWPGIHAKLA